MQSPESLTFGCAPVVPPTAQPFAVAVHPVFGARSGCGNRQRNRRTGPTAPGAHVALSCTKHLAFLSSVATPPVRTSSRCDLAVSLETGPGQ